MQIIRHRTICLLWPLTPDLWPFSISHDSQFQLSLLSFFVCMNIEHTEPESSVWHKTLGGLSDSVNFLPHWQNHCDIILLIFYWASFIFSLVSWYGVLSLKDRNNLMQIVKWSGKKIRNSLWYFPTVPHLLFLLLSFLYFPIFSHLKQHEPLLKHFNQPLHPSLSSWPLCGPCVLACLCHTHHTRSHALSHTQTIHLNQHTAIFWQPHSPITQLSGTMSCS